MRALVLAWLYLCLLAVPGVLLAGARAAAQTPAQQITNCGSEFGTAGDDSIANPAQGTVAYAVDSGGTWTFACSGTGPFNIAVTTPLTVARGQTVALLGGGQDVTLDGGLQTRISSVRGSLTLDALTLEGGFATVGGAVYDDGGTLTVSNSTFSGNDVPSAGAVNQPPQGGAIYNDGGVLTVSNCTFSANLAGSESGARLTYGGAIANTGTLTVSGSTFSDNSAGAAGGAIFNFGGTLSVTNSTFDGNVLLSGEVGGAVAGAIANLTGTLTIENSTFDDNSAGISGLGGAIANGGTLTVAGSSFTGDFSPANSVLGGAGGAIENLYTGTATVTQSTFSGDYASAGDGGAIDNQGMLTVADSGFDGDGLTSTLDGGAISMDPVTSGERVSITDSTFSGNTSTEGGGAIYLGSGTVIVTNSALSGNQSLSGGAIENGGPTSTGGRLTVADSVLSDDLSLTGGGAIASTDTASVSNAAFDGNEAAGSGGAISNSSGGTLTLTDSSFSVNTSLRNGGAISSGSNALEVAVTDSSFSGNQSNGDGGAISNSSGSALTVADATFSGNQANGNGGAISSGSGGVGLAVTNSTLSGNLAQASGGAIFSGSTTSGTTVTDTTLSGNGAAAGGGNLYGGGELTDTIVASPQSGGNCAGGTYSGTNDLEYGDTTCSGSVTDWVYGNPDLSSLAPIGGPTETMALAATSPAVGAGAAAACAADPFDQRGFPRPPSGCDIGAFESTAPSAPDLPVYAFAATPIAPSGGLTPADTVAATVYAQTYDGQRVPYAPVYLSLTGTGAAVADGVALTPTPQLFGSDASGQVQVSFTPGPPLIGGGSDLLTASGVPGAGLAPATDTYTYPAPVAALAFATPPLSGPASAVAALGPIQVELRQAGGGAALAPPGGVTVTLASSDATGGFASTLGGNPSPSLPVTIPAGGSVSANVYFADTSAGTPAVTATASALGSVSQQETVTAATASTLTLAPEVDSLPVNATTTVSGRVYDSHGNPVPDPAVTLTATAGGFSSLSTVYGGYSATFQAPPTPGAVTLTAAVYGGAAAQTLLLVTPQGVTAPSVDVGPGSAAVQDLTATGSGGTGDVEVADYSGDPAGTPTFASSGVYFDVAQLQGSSFSSLTLQRCGVSAGQALYWWNGTAWATVSTSPAPAYDAATGCLNVTLDAASSPSLADLTATPFALSAAPAPVSAGGGGGGGGYLAPAPAVTAIAPPSGPTAGDTRVTITGSGFTGATAVDFGVTPAALFSVDSDTQVTAVSPAGSGTVDVTVTTPSGTSATSTADRFTYVAPAKTPPAQLTFPDVPPTYWAYADIERLALNGIVDGFPDGSFRPHAPVTRAQFVTMLDRTLRLAPSPLPTPFADVAPSAWYAPYVSAAVRAGIVAGVSPTRFDPNAPLTREQMAVLLARALKLTRTAAPHFTDDAAIDPWARPGVDEALAAGYIDGFPNGTFQPLATATRAQAAKVLALVLRNPGA